MIYNRFLQHVFDKYENNIYDFGVKVVQTISIGNDSKQNQVVKDRNETHESKETK